MSSQRKSLLKKNIWLYFFSFIIAPTGYIVKITISSDVSVESLGILYGIISFVTILSSYNDLGMTESMNYFLPKYFHQKDTKKTTQVFLYAIGMQLITSCILALLLYIGSDWLASNYFQDESAGMILKIFILFFFGENLFKTINTFFQAAQNTKLQKGTEFLRMMSLVSYTLGLFLLDLGTLERYAWGWIYSIFFGVIISACVLLFQYRDRLNWNAVHFDKELFKGLMKYALWVVLSVNAAMLLSQIDMQMILAMLGPREAGYYTNYLSIMRMPFMFLLPGVVFLFPVFSDFFQKGEIHNITRIRKIAYTYFSALGVLTGFFFFVFGDLLTYVLFGEQYETSGNILLYSCMFLMFNFLLQIDFQIFSATGRPRQKMYILLIGIAINFITNLILITYLGVYGAALATGIGWIVLWLLSLRKIGPEFHFSFDGAFFLKNFIVFGIIFLLAYYSHLPYERHGRIEDLFLLIGIGAVCATIFFILNKSHILTTIRGPKLKTQN